MPPTVLQITLRDPVTNTTVQATMEATEHGINLGFAGYGDRSSAVGSGTPVFIGLHDGHLTVHVWADINQEESTHTIHLENAREILRR